MSHQVFIARIFAAFILGMLIGIERQWRQRMAGLRTNTLVCVGSAIFVALTGLTQGETTRIAGQVVTGIGFLGAGVILREGLNVRGLNTAATLWCAAAVGVLAGMGFILEATIGTTAAIIPAMTNVSAVACAEKSERMRCRQGTAARSVPSPSFIQRRARAASACSAPQ